MIFSDATLRDMCRIKPMNREAFMQVSGVGEVKAKRYGTAFITEIKRFMGEPEAMPEKPIKPVKQKANEYVTKSWDDVEMARLRREVLTGKSIGELAKLHNCDPMEIAAKLRELSR